MAPVSLTKAALFGALCESLLYGFLTALFFYACGSLLSRRHRRDGINKSMIGSACLLWILATLHVVIVLSRIVIAFITHGDTVGGPEAYLAMEFTPVFIAMQCVFTSINGVTDLIMLYRAWLIWDRNYWVIAPPLCSFCGAFISSVISIYYQAMLQPGQQFADAPIVVASGDALFVFALITNFTTTALIAGRIFYLFRVRMGGLQATHTHQYLNIVGMMVESGAIMAAAQAIELGLWAVQNVMIWTFVSIVAQVMAISPMLILARAAAEAAGAHPAHSLFFASTAPSRTLDPPNVVTGVVTLRERFEGDARHDTDAELGDVKYAVDPDAFVDYAVPAGPLTRAVKSKVSSGRPVARA